MKSVFNRFNFVRSDGWVHIVLFFLSPIGPYSIIVLSLFEEGEGGREEVSFNYFYRLNLPLFSSPLLLQLTTRVMKCMTNVLDFIVFMTLFLFPKSRCRMQTHRPKKERKKKRMKGVARKLTPRKGQLQFQSEIAPFPFLAQSEWQYP